MSLRQYVPSLAESDKETQNRVDQFHVILYAIYGRRLKREKICEVIRDNENVKDILCSLFEEEEKKVAIREYLSFTSK